MRIDDMEALAIELGIIIDEVGKEYHDDFEEGQIISFKAPEVVRVRDVVEIITSRGTDKVVVPDVVNRDQADAFALFEEAGFTVPPRIDRVYSDDMPIDIVISQSHNGEEIVSKETTVTLTVSRGPEAKYAVVPDVIGQTESRAIEMLQAVGLVPFQEQRSHSVTIPEGSVMRQSARSGEEAREGSIVRITVSLGPETPADGDRNGNGSSEQPIGGAKQLVVNPYIQIGTESVHVRILRIDLGASSVFFDEVVSPGFFPHTFDVTGQGTVDFHVFFVDENGAERRQALQTIVFD
jgi:serine/threonine-protein kinase